MGRILNEKYRDTIFRMLFGEDKKALLSLYNALNGTDYDNPDELEINTLEDSVYMGIKNDVSFIIKNEMVLGEHQSTINPNMPLRDLFYVTDLYEIYTADMNIYGVTKLRIPAPKFIVLYNGGEKIKDKTIYKLSDLYAEGKSGDLELSVTMYNINYGHNEKLVNGCRKLKEYSIFVDKVKRYKKYDSFKSIKSAVSQAIKECLKEGVLVDFLKKHRVEEMAMNFLYEFDAKRQSELDRRDGREEGIEIGRKEGIFLVVSGALRSGKTPEQIAEFNGIPVDEVIKIQKKMLEEA